MIVMMLIIDDVKRVSQRSAESRGFSPGSPVSSHRERWVNPNCMALPS